MSPKSRPSDTEGTAPTVSGALAGWRHESIGDTLILRLQIVRSFAALELGQLQIVDLALNERQLRSLARDLVRAAEARGIVLWAPRRRGWFRFRPHHPRGT